MIGGTCSNRRISISVGSGEGAGRAKYVGRGRIIGDTVQRKNGGNMTQCERIIECFENHGGKVTLGELLEEGRYSFAHKLTARLSDLRAKGFIITCTTGENPSRNIYEMIPPNKHIGEMTFSTEENGQLIFI